MRIAVLNGPSLDLLGEREPEIYGTATLGDIEASLRAVGAEIGVEVEFAQRSGEGELIDCIHALRGRTQGALVNAGAYTHTSLALRDALAAARLPFVEVHLTNIFAREPERRQSMLAAGAVGIVCGFGAFGYEIALRGLVRALAVRD
ncbi:MAG: 3-dehydroquinate dehydratase [Gemmatimonadota bacterium]|nr:3-dehydroquinate dehydratase [Gemmatimonadota bacterium]